MSRPATPTCLLTTQPTFAFSAQTLARPAAAILSAPPAPTPRLSPSMVSVTTAHTLATLAQLLPLPALLVSRASTLSELLVSLLAQLELSPRMESVFADQEFFSATSASPLALKSMEISVDFVRNAMPTAQAVMEPRVFVPSALTDMPLTKYLVSANWLLLASSVSTTPSQLVAAPEFAPRTHTSMRMSALLPAFQVTMTMELEAALLLLLRLVVPSLTSSATESV